MTNFTFQTYQLSEGLSQKHDIRVVTVGDDPWFVAADVAKVLGLPNITVTLKSKYIDPKEKATTVVGHRTVNIISESGLYKLIMRSDKKQAKAFQDWVTREVLPAIRKDGAYISGEERLATGEMSEEDQAASNATRYGTSKNAIRGPYRVFMALTTNPTKNLPRDSTAASYGYLASTLHRERREHTTQNREVGPPQKPAENKGFLIRLHH